MAIESPQLNQARTGAGRHLRGLAVAALSFGAGLLMALLALLMVGRAAQSWPGSLLGSWLQRATHTDVVYTMDKIVTGEKESVILPNFLAGDRLLLLVHGEVIAGIDFQTLKPSDVLVNGKKIRMRLPQAQVLVTKLDSAKTRVYSRQTGLLVATDPNLESQVREEAERDLRRSALADGIMQKAQENARSTVTSLMQSMGFEEVQFE